MKKLKLPQNPFLLFLPFLVLFIILVLIYPTSGTFGDENRYLIYARYMIDGFLPASDLNFDHLGNGPGYSILLIPFIAFHIPIIWITLLNAILLYLSIVLLFKAAVKVVSLRPALIISLFWACFINSYVYIGKILPETLTSFLICLLIYCLINAFNSDKPKRYLYFSGFIIGYIALTKPIFGYVLLCMLIGSCILWVINRKAKTYKNATFILVIALATTMPYLTYTYSVTGRIFYWSSVGGNNLYWTTETDEFEYGSWFPDPQGPMDPATKFTHLPNFEEQVKAKHAKDFEEINKYKGVEQDDAYKRIAINNIKAHPWKYIQNCISNVGRLFFNFPYSYKIQSPYTLIRLPFTGIIAILMLFCIFPTLRNWKKIDFSVRFMLLFALIYFGGSILGSAETRMFTIVVPIFLLWIAYMLQKTVKIDFGKWTHA